MKTQLRPRDQRNCEGWLWPTTADAVEPAHVLGAGTTVGGEVAAVVIFTVLAASTVVAPVIVYLSAREIGLLLVVAAQMLPAQTRRNR